MSDSTDVKPALGLEEVAVAAAEIGREAAADAATSRFASAVRRWAEPALTVGIERDAKGEGGWRVVPELTSGNAPPGAERSFGRMIEDGPASAYAKPTLVRPGEGAAMPAKARGSWIVPWSCGESSGFLLLQDVGDPHPPNLGDAVGVLLQPLLPILRKARGPADAAAGEDRLRRLNELMTQAQALSEGLRTDARVEEERIAAEAARRSEPERARLRAELETSRGEIAALRESLEEGKKAVEAARSEAAAAREKVEPLEKTKAEIEAARDASWAEARDLRGKVDGLVADLEAARKGADEALREKAEVLEKGRGEAEMALNKAAAELAEAKTRAEAMDKELAATRRTADDARAETANMRVAVDEAVKARDAAEARRERAQVEINQLWSSVESLQRQLQSDAERYQGERSALEDARRGQVRLAADAALSRENALAERDEARAAATAAKEASERAVEKARVLEERWEACSSAFTSALEAMRRTPFVPPALRVSLSSTERFLAPKQGPAPTARTLFLDRDTAGLEALAAELEAAGIEALVAHYPEEVSFFLKTPDARKLTAVICDVMAFRSDQDLTGLFRAWKQDAPGVSLLLSFKADHAAEAEKAQRVPTVLTAGYLPRPLEKGKVSDTIVNLGKRAATATGRLSAKP
jgi:hypothetical protein